MMIKKGPNNTPLEHIESKGAVWMPYHRIRFEYRRSEKDLIRKFGETAQSETALNAMFCDCARESELFTLFRPNYLKYTMITYSPRSDEIIGPIFHMDFDEVLSRLLRRLNEVKRELYELRSKLNKRYVQNRRHSMILPVMGGLKEEEKLSEKIAKLDALMNIFGMCLNLDEDAESIKVLYNSTFFYPTVVAALRHREREAERFLIINLVKKGSVSKRLNYEDGLTQLCDKNDACKEVLARSITRSGLRA